MMINRVEQWTSKLFVHLDSKISRLLLHSKRLMIISQVEQLSSRIFIRSNNQSITNLNSRLIMPETSVNPLKL